MKTLGLFLSLFCSFLSLSASLVIVENEKPTATLILGKRPTLDAQFAAKELQVHVKLITGAELPIVDDSKPLPSGVRIFVGDSRHAAERGFKSGNYKGEEYELKISGNDIFLSGQEVANRTRMDYGHFQGIPRFFVPNHGLLWATYDFLEKCCDVRWYGPGDIGICYTPRRTLKVKRIRIRREPFMSAFRMISMPRQLVTKNCYGTKYPITAADLEIFTLRWRFTNRYGSSNHNVAPLYYAYWKETANKKIAALKPFREHRPEYFAQGYKGQGMRHLGMQRSFPNDLDLPPQPCMTHPKVIEFFAQAAEKDYLRKPFPGSFNASPHLKDAPFFYPIQEDDNHAYCKCPNCTKAFADKGALQPAYLRFNWVNEIAKAAKKRNPNLNISTLSYGCAQEYPHGLKLADNLAVQLVLHCSNYFHPAYREREMKIFRDWTEDSAKGKRLITLWTHYLAPCWDAKMVEKYNDYFPVFHYDELGKFFQRCAERGVRGWFSESPLELGYTLTCCQLELYVSIRLADDPTLNPQTLIDEFFTRWYGHAATPMRKFYGIIAKASNDIRNYPRHYADEDYFKKHRLHHNFQPEQVNWGRIGTAERMKQLAACMEQAKNSAVTPQEKTRIDILEKGLWASMRRGRRNFEQKERFKKRPTPEMVVPKIAKANGDATRVPWAQAASTGEWKLINGLPAHLPGCMRLAHDGDYLYLHYKEPHQRSLNASKGMWGGDGLDLIFAPHRRKPYVQLAINPEGLTHGYAYFASADAAYSIPWTFNQKLVIKQENGWEIYLAIPLASLNPAGTATPPAIYANFYRFVPRELSRAWSPTFNGSHHEITRFGKLKFQE